MPEENSARLILDEFIGCNKKAIYKNQDQVLKVEVFVDKFDDDFRMVVLKVIEIITPSRIYWMQNYSIGETFTKTVRKFHNSQGGSWGLQYL